MEESDKVSMERRGDTVAIPENSFVSSDIKSAGTLLISLASKNRHTSNGQRRIFEEEKVMLAECLEKGIGTPGFKRYHIEALRQAVRFLNLEVAEFLLVGDSTLDLICDDHEILYLALRNGDGIPHRWDNELLHQMMSLLISHGAPVNANAPHGDTALFLTCDYGLLRAFQILLQAGADHSTLHRLKLVERNDSESTTNPGRTSELNLFQVALNARLRHEGNGTADDEYTESYYTDIWGPIIQYLYGAGLRTAPNDASLVKFLHVVCHLGRMDYVELVLRHGVDVHAKAARVDSRDTVYGSALHAAAAGGHEDIVRRLLDYGADPRAARLQEYMKPYETDEFITPIAAALKSRRFSSSSIPSQEVLDACEAILDAGTSEADRKLLVVAVAKKGNVQMLNRLMQPGLTIDQVPLCSSIKVIKFFLDHGTAIHAKEFQKYALKEGLLDLFKFLVDEFGPLLTTVEELRVITPYDPLRDKYFMILDYLIRDYSHSTFDGRSLHGDIATGLFRRFCSKLPFGQVQSTLQDAVKSGCPGVYRGTLATLATELHQLRPNRFRVPGEMTKERVRLYQLLLRFSDEAEFQKREDSSKLWLTPGNVPQYIWDHVDSIATDEANNRDDGDDLSEDFSSIQCSEGDAETSLLKDHDSDQEATPQARGDSLQNVAKVPATDISAVSDDDMVLPSEESLIDCGEDISDLDQADSGQVFFGFDFEHYKRLYRESVGNTAAKSGSTPSLPPPPSSRARDSLSAKYSRFEYDQLDGSFAIRLVSIEPSNDPTAVLCCHIATTNLGLFPEYEALSYVWGELPGIADITLNGFEFTITRSLWSALRRLRDPDKERRLWVDALCINQNSIPERNQQVRIMRQIYESARQTIVWVGEEADDSHLVFEHANSWKMYADDYIAGRTNRNDEFGEAHLNMPSYRGNTLEAFDRFCRRSYFYRSWVIQEVAVSNQVLVTCGRDQAELHLLLHSGSSGSGNPYDPFCGVDPATHFYGLQELSEERNLRSVLQYSRFCDATDPRDKIFGLLGLFVKPLIDVDYALDVETVFRKFTEAIIRDEQNIEFLHWFGASERHVHGLPSWVPDYTASKPSGVLPQVYGDGSYAVTAASDSLRKVLPGMQIDGSRLRIKGSHLDTILHISVTLSPHPENHPDSDSFRSIMHDWEETAATILPRKRYANPVAEVFLRTLIAGQQCRETAKMLWYSDSGSGTLKDLENDHFNDFNVLRAWRNEGDRSAHDDAIILSHFKNELKDCCYGRRLFVTERGSMGLAPPSAQEGDLVVFFSGGIYPFVLRPLGDETFAMMGDCYLYEPGRNSFTHDDFNPHNFYKDDIYRDVTEWVIR